MKVFSWTISFNHTVSTMPKLNPDAKIGFVLNDFTNLRDAELRLLIKLKYMYDKYIVFCKHGEMCVSRNKPKVDN